jgi:ferrous iron transport protein A
MTIDPTVLLNHLPDGGRAVVARVVSASAEVDAVALRRLGELGFIPGEPVQLLRRGPGGREPLAVLVGETMFALRLLEAQCIEVILKVETGVAQGARRDIEAAAGATPAETRSAETIARVGAERADAERGVAERAVARPVVATRLVDGERMAGAAARPA